MIYIEINNGPAEYLNKYGISPDVLFINYSTYQELCNEPSIGSLFSNNPNDSKVSECYGKPVYLLHMKVPYLWIDQYSLNSIKNIDLQSEMEDITFNINYKGRQVALVVPKEIVNVNL